MSTSVPKHSPSDQFVQKNRSSPQIQLLRHETTTPNSQPTTAVIRRPGSFSTLVGPSGAPALGRTIRRVSGTKPPVKFVVVVNGSGPNATKLVSTTSPGIQGRTVGQKLSPHVAPTIRRVAYSSPVLGQPRSAAAPRILVAPRGRTSPGLLTPAAR